MHVTYMVIAPGFTPFYTGHKGVALANAKLMAGSVVYKLFEDDSKVVIYRNTRR